MQRSPADVRWDLSRPGILFPVSLNPKIALVLSVPPARVPSWLLRIAVEQELDDLSSPFLVAV